MKSNKSKSLIFANIVIGSMVIIFILAIAYLFYRSNATQLPLNIKLVVLFIAGLLFSIFVFFIRDSWKINVAVFIFSVLIAAYGLELVLFAQYKIRFPQANIDTRNKLEVLEDLRAEGIDAWPHVIPYLFVESNGLLSNNKRIFPLGGISQKTIVYCNESGQFMNFKSDEHGFNNPEGLYKKGIIKVALIGDSFTLGNCVKPGEDIAGRLRNFKINTLNLGNGGNGPLIELAELKEYAEPIQSEIVLWVYFEGNDLFELEKERNSSILVRYLEDNYSQNLFKQQAGIDVALMNYVSLQWLKNTDMPQIQNRIVNQPFLMQQMEAKENKGKLFKLWHLRRRIGLLTTSNQSQKLDPKRVTNKKAQLSLFSDILAVADKRVTSWGGHFYFVYLPDMERYVNDNLDGSFFDRDDVIAIVHKHGIPLIDFHELLDKHPDPLSLSPFLGAHYNAQGYKLVSEFIVSRLKKDGLISIE